MAVHAHARLLLLLLSTLLLLLHAPAPAAAVATSCEPRVCGNLTIAYPFWLPDIQASTTSSSSPAAAPPPCGPSAFQVNCSGGVASLARSFQGGYKILRVSYSNRTLVVSNGNVQTDAAGCPAPRIDVSASLSLAPFSASAANAQLLFLFNCTGGGGSAPPAAGFVNVTCPGEQAVVRLDARYNTSAARAVAGSCGYSVVPVLGFPGARAGDYPKLLRGGYLLEWRAAPGDCAACNASGGRCGYDADADAFACICSDGSTRPARCDAKKSGKAILIVSLSITFGLLLALLLILIKFRRRINHSFSLPSIMDRRRASSDTANVEKLLQKYGALAPKRYRYSELKKITDSFKHKLGEGGYGAVFRGVLPGAGGGAPREVAVKVLHHSRPNGEEFLNEVISIGRTSHVNIVTLLGFCLEGSTRRALVYEYMPNGSLDRYIYSSSSAAAGDPPAAALGWEALQEIAGGIARGLEYLHEGCNTRIIHFDIKPQNVLLDAGLRPKIADFGMAKLCDTKESILSVADARGTIGFIAPEVFSRGFGVVSAKSDVYSYGMLLLEMVAGGSNVKAYAAEKSGDGGELFFPLWVYDHLLEDGGVLQMQSGGGGAGAGEEIARKMALIGLWCIQTVPASRPSMSRVLEMLERSIHELPMPPRPYHASPSNSPSPSHPSSYPSSTSDFTLRSSRLLTPESTA
ncbi:unnamed protein product [Urochloa decumbens]|uniref:Protein kinase domain-containing protein n=1 Tax=Urochloa decumbens TaxID=240449 RepID=A0ABC9H7D3_9POAL